MRRLFLLMCVLGLVLAIAAPAGAQDEADSEAPAEEATEGTTEFEKAVQLIEPSVVYLGITVTGYVQDHDGDWLNNGEAIELTSQCSGTVVDPAGYILSAGHCVDPGEFRANFIQAGVADWIENGWNLNEDGTVAVTEEELFEIGFDNWTVEGEQPGSPATVDVSAWLASSVSGLANGREMGARVVDYQPLMEGDVAFLKVEQEGLPVAPVATADPNVGADIVSVGFPASVDAVTDPDLNAAYKDGRISQQRTRADGTLPVWEISSAMSGGMSGGPTVNLDGEVVGVNSYSPTGEEQQFNFVSPAELIREVASRNGVPLEVDEISQSYHEGVVALHDGQPQQAIDAFDAVLADQPSHSKAADLKRIAERELGEAPEEPAEDASKGAGAGGAEGEQTRPQAAAAPAADQQGAPGWIWLLVAALVILLLLAGGMGFLLMRARRGTPSRGPGGAWAADDNGEVTHDLGRDKTAPRS